MRTIKIIIVLLFCAIFLKVPSAYSDPQQISFPTSVSGIAIPKYVVVSDNRVWIAGAANNTGFTAVLVSCIDVVSGQKCSTQYPLTIKDSGQVEQQNSSGLAAGKDGSIWATSQNQDSVAKINPANGSYSVFLTGGDSPQGITVGIDGDIWIANVDSNNLSRLDPQTGTLRAGYPKASGAANVSGYVIGPTRLTVDKNGFIWSVIFDGTPGQGYIGKFDPSTDSVVAGFPKTTSAEPNSIITGEDGDIFVSNTGSLARFDSSSGLMLSGYPKFIISDPADEGIVKGPDGNIWFTEPFLSQVSRFDPVANQVVSGYPITITGSSPKPEGLAFDTYGNLWIAVQETSKNRLVKLLLNENVPTPVPTAAPTNTNSGSDQCPLDDAKTEPGVCGCGMQEFDSNNDTIIDCGNVKVFSKTLKPNLAKADITGNSAISFLVENVSGVKLTYEFDLTGPKGFKKTIKSKNGKANFTKLKIGSYKLKVLISGKVGKVIQKSKSLSAKYTLKKV